MILLKKTRHASSQEHIRDYQTPPGEEKEKRRRRKLISSGDGICCFVVNVSAFIVTC